VVGAAVLVFPVALGWLHAGGRSLSDPATHASFADLARLSLGPAPGSWPTGFFLPAAALVAFAFVPPPFHTVARRAALTGVIALYGAWFSAAGYLPSGLSNAVVFVGLLALSYALLIGMGLVFLVRGATSAAFGVRQVGAVALAGILTVGLGAQVIQAAGGGWTIGGSDRVPAAYPVVSRGGDVPYRVLWLGEPDGRALVPPAGLPDGTVAAGAASVSYAIDLPGGASALDTGRAAAGPGYAALEQVLQDVLAGDARHGGALLAPFGVRYVVASPGKVPEAALRRLLRQTDLDLVPAEGLIILRNSKAFPLAGATGDPSWVSAARAASPQGAAILPETDGTVLHGSGQVYSGQVPDASSLALLSQQYDGGWRLHPLGAGDAPGAPGRRSFGWAVGFEEPTAGSFTIRYAHQSTRTMEVVLLVALWALALWMTRRTTRKVRPRG